MQASNERRNGRSLEKGPAACSVQPDAVNAKWVEKMWAAKIVNGETRQELWGWNDELVKIIRSTNSKSDSWLCALTGFDD